MALASASLLDKAVVSVYRDIFECCALMLGSAFVPKNVRGRREFGFTNLIASVSLLGVGVNGHDVTQMLVHVNGVMRFDF